MTAHGPKDKLKELLIQAYLAREQMEVGARWQENLMTGLRRIGPLRPEPPFLAAFEQFVWRLAPVVCVLAVVLFALLIKTGFASWDDPIQLFVSGGEESMLAHFFGA